MFRFTQHDRQKASPSLHSSPADGDHLAVRLIIVAEVVLLRFSIDHIEKELLKLLITRASPQRFHDVELQIAPQAGTQFPVAGKPQFVAAFTEMQIGHRSYKTDLLFAVGNLIISRRPVCSKFRLWDETPVNRFD